MGFDKLVDSVKLNGALTATADAIREKNGGSAKIPWDAVKGFADVISALNCVKTGTLTATSGVPSTVRIEGLGFKPSTIILFALVSGVNVSLNENCLYAIFNGNGTTSYYSYTSVEEKEVKILGIPEIKSGDMKDYCRNLIPNSTALSHAWDKELWCKVC